MNVALLDFYAVENMKSIYMYTYVYVYTYTHVYRHIDIYLKKLFTYRHISTCIMNVRLLDFYAVGNMKSAYIHMYLYYLHIHILTLKYVYICPYTYIYIDI
jgi:hypothetical protein